MIEMSETGHLEVMGFPTGCVQQQTVSRIGEEEGVEVLVQVVSGEVL